MRPIPDDVMKYCMRVYGDYISSGLGKGKFASLNQIDRFDLNKIIEIVEKANESHKVFSAIINSLVTFDDYAFNLAMRMAYRKTPEQIDSFLRKVTGYSLGNYENNVLFNNEWEFDQYEAEKDEYLKNKGKK
jgi:hypothetical protein